MKTPRTSKLPPFYTQAVGSLPRPRVALDLLSRRQEFTPERFGQIMDDLVRFAIRLQGLSGLDVVSDGQWHSAHHLGEFMRRVGSFERVRKLPSGMAEVVVRRMNPTGSVFKADADFLVNNTARLTKLIIPSPFPLAMAYWHPDYSTVAYPTREHFMAHLVEILAAEVHALVTAGIDIIQLDDTALPCFCDRRSPLEEVYDEALRRNWDIDTQFPLWIDAINRIVEVAAGKAEIHLHLGRRAGTEVVPDYRPILSRLKPAKIDRINLAFACREGMDELSLLPAHIDVGLGVLDVRPGSMQTAEALQDLALAAAKILPASRIALNPDAGFAPDTGEAPSLDEAYDKLRRLTMAAKQLRARVS